jgi:hypothetical protein
MEARAKHAGVLFNEEVHGVIGSLSMSILIRGLEVTVFNQAIDLLRYGGRLNFHGENIWPTAGDGSLTVRQFPTLGRTSNTNTGSQGTVDLVNCSVYVERSNTSSFGNYMPNATGRISVRNANPASTNASMAVDALGWFFIAGPVDGQQLGMQLNSVPTLGRLVWNNDSSSAQIGSDLRLILPRNARPLKLIMLKLPQQLSAGVSFSLYLCKDAANWAIPGKFQLNLDAILVATLPDNRDAAGYWEAPVQLTANLLGGDLRSGFGAWTEGRMYLKKNGPAGLSGWVGVEYI